MTPLRLIAGSLTIALAAFFASFPALSGVVAALMPVVVYDGPSENGLPRYLLGKGYPLVVISDTDDWLTVCMHDGSSGYVNRRDTLPGNNVIVLDSTILRSDPNPDGTVKMKLGRGLMLASTGDQISGWLPVRHENGISGFVELARVWGHSSC